MFSLMDGAFEPSTKYSEQITFLTSLRHLQSIRADNNCLSVVEKIKELISQKRTRLQGLQCLEIALQQSPDIYMKGRWNLALFDVLKEPISYKIKEHICKILCLLIPLMAKDPAANAAELQKFASAFFPYILGQIDNEVEWTASAGMCLSAGLKYFPQKLEQQKPRIMSVICRLISRCPSSKTFEVFAECFALLPSCTHDLKLFEEEWYTQYLKTINSMHNSLNLFLTQSDDDMYTETCVPGVESFIFETQKTEKLFADYMIGVRRFINLCMCASKMLSTRCKQHVKIPYKLTIECVIRLFQVQDMAKNPLTPEAQIVVSTLSQMQIASLVIVEALILSCPTLLAYSFLMTQLFILGLQASEIPRISPEPVRPLRQAIWKLMTQWVSRHGTSVTSDIVSRQSLIIHQLLKDIRIENSQVNAVQSSKSKKSLGMTPGQRSLANRNQLTVCNEALKALECILYSGAPYLTKSLFEEIFSQVIQVAEAITSTKTDTPYEEALCRKQLYSVLLACIVISKADQRGPIQRASGIFRIGLQDPSTKVTRFCHKAIATCRLCLHPRKPTPKVKEYEEQPTRVNEVVRYSEWTSEDYVQNLPPVVENVSESINSRVAHTTFHNPNEDEMPSDKYMQVDAHYSDQAVENQCNGEDSLEIQNSSQCQDDEDSDDEDEEEDEDEADEELNQDMQHLYIPSTSKIQVLNPVHITVGPNEQNVDEQEYEELRPCKSDDSNKNMHLNGVRSNILPEEELPSSSTQNIASENGIYASEYEDLEEDEGDEDEEDDVVYPADKKIPDYYENPSKKQKIDNEVNEKPLEEREGSRSPTLVEMKADFCCNEDDVKS